MEANIKLEPLVSSDETVMEQSQQQQATVAAASAAAMDIDDEEVAVTPKVLKSATGGLGGRLRPEDDGTEQLEKVRYVPLNKRLRNETENLAYVEVEREKFTNKILKENSEKLKKSLKKKNDQKSASSNNKSNLLDRADKMRIDANADFIRLNEDSDEENLGLNGLSLNDKLFVYEKYRMLEDRHRYDLKLPIISMKDELLERIRNQNIVIVQGSTGCGKTTQIPQLILDEHVKRNEFCNIVVTQPRRLAAISVASRVCKERNWQLGSLCGYRVGLKSKSSVDSRILYVTTGYLKERMIGNPDCINDYTHLILDEIHERDVNIDFLLMIIKIAFLKKYTGKLVIMSATLDPEELLEYFRDISQPNLNAPVIRCSIKIHDVKEYYLDDFNDKLGLSNVNMKEILPKFDPINPKQIEELLDILPDLLTYLDQKELESQENRVANNGLPLWRGSVLIFVPGKEEINRVFSWLSNHERQNGLKLLALHSEIALDQQMLVHEPPRPGERKIIVSTSIAESSITVPDVKYVIDFCLTKTNRCDLITNLSSLVLEWANKSSMDQRRGRAGRVGNGICFRLMPKHFFEHSTDKSPQPEILRGSLDKFVLDTKRYNAAETPKAILSMALSPPSLDMIERSIVSLKEAGAISLYKNGKVCADDGDLTYAGTIMGGLPIDIKLGKLILFGMSFGKLEDSIILAASLYNKSIYSSHLKSNFDYYTTKHRWSHGTFCDFSTSLNSYNVYLCHEKLRTFKSKWDLDNWARDNLLEVNRIKEIKILIEEIKQRLNRHNIKVEDNGNAEDYRERETTLKNIDDEQKIIDEFYIVKFMVAGAFYPNYFKTNPVDEQNIQKSLSCKDPKSTVLLKFENFRGDSILYHSKLKEKFETLISSPFLLHYEHDRAFIQFLKTDEHLNSKIVRGVYFAVALKDLFNGKNHLSIEDLAPTEKNRELKKEITELKFSKSIYSSSSRKPAAGAGDTAGDPNLLFKERNEFPIVVTEIEELGHFWAQINEDAYMNKLEHVQELLNRQYYNHFLKLIPISRLQVGQLVATPFLDESTMAYTFFRARILRIRPQSASVNVLYVDYGNKEEKDWNLMYELDHSLAAIPQLAIECKMIKMRINPFIHDNRAHYEKLSDQFSSLLHNNKLKISIYSIVDNLVRCSLIDVTNELMHVDLLQKLIKLGLAEECDEDHISKQNHKDRQNRSFLRGQGPSTQDWISVNDEKIQKLLSQLTYDPTTRIKPDKHSPYSPLQCTLTAMTQCNSMKTVCIGKESINYVLLDDEPEVKCSKLLIAHEVRLDTGRSRGDLVLRNTTLFPKINGLVSLCLLMFAPAAELRVDKQKKKYTGALCGLGYDREKNTPIHLENDIEDTFQVEFDSKDLKQINSIRHGINLVIGNKREAESLLRNPDRLRYIQSNNRKLILHLLKKQRYTTDEPIFFDKKYKWNQINESEYVYDDFLSDRIDKLIRHSLAYYSNIKEYNFNPSN